jgi:sortase (surface protein transpeptidase)
MGTPIKDRHSRAVLAVSVACIIAALWSLVLGAGSSPVAHASKIPARATAALPKPGLVVAPIAVAAHPAPECPQMNNPGGRLQWGPTTQLGPDQTNGTIDLPTLGVRAPIVRVGIDGQARMVVPTNARDVAWLDRGGIPGYTHNVVLAGHIDYSRIPGSFMRIAELRPGDEIAFAMDGRQHTYHVVWTCAFPRETDRAEQIMGYTDKPSLTLITCGGSFDSSAGTHSLRVVVRAEEDVPTATASPAGPGGTASSTPPPTPDATPVSILPLKP